MPRRLELQLSDEQRAELVALRDHHPKAYMRERAAAVLKVAGGMSIRGVACSGLLRRRHAETVCIWLQRYRTEGPAGLEIRKGRGRKPAFSPPLRQRRCRTGGVVALGAAGPTDPGRRDDALDVGQHPTTGTGNQGQR